MKRCLSASDLPGARLPQPCPHEDHHPRDVARQAGVSVGTASRVMNDREDEVGRIGAPLLLDRMGGLDDPPARFTPVQSVSRG